MSIRPRTAEGFSLVELLVVLVILGVLVGIAAPRLLSQRQDAQNAAAVTDLRNLISVQLGLEADGTGYSDDQATVAAEGWSASPNVTVCVDLLPGNDLSIVAWSVQGDLVYSWQRTVAGVDADPVPLPSDCTGMGNEVS